ALGCDFYAFSGHKMLGPTGAGILYGRRELLEQMDPFMGGGDMIKTVRVEGTTYHDLPWKFEAGTQAIGEVIGLGAAVDYIAELDQVCLRAGHHCAMPLMTRLGVPATARASFYVYTQKDEVDRLVGSIKEAQRIFK